MDPSLRSESPRRRPFSVGSGGVSTTWHVSRHLSWSTSPPSTVTMTNHDHCYHMLPISNHRQFTVVLWTSLIRSCNHPSTTKHMVIVYQLSSSGNQSIRDHSRSSMLVEGMAYQPQSVEPLSDRPLSSINDSMPFHGCGRHDSSLST